MRITYYCSSYVFILLIVFIIIFFILIIVSFIIFLHFICFFFIIQVDNVIIITLILIIAFIIIITNLRWLMGVWNKSIVPMITNAIDKTSFTSLKIPQSDTKMVFTALYVLIQRAILPDCPLASPGMSSGWRCVFCL